MIRRPPRSTRVRSSAASDVYKRQTHPFTRRSRHVSLGSIMRKNILITGASSGLGAGMARIFAAKGHNLALTARRLDRLEALKAELLTAHGDIDVCLLYTSPSPRD